MLLTLKAVGSPLFACCDRRVKKLAPVTFPATKAAPERCGRLTSTHLLNFHALSDRNITESKHRLCLLVPDQQRVSFSQQSGGKVFSPPALCVRCAIIIIFFFLPFTRSAHLLLRVIRLDVFFFLTLYKIEQKQRIE